MSAMAHPLLTGRTRSARDDQVLEISFRLRDSNRVMLGLAFPVVILFCVAMPILFFSVETSPSPGETVVPVLMATGVVIGVIWLLFGRQVVRVERDALAVSTVLGPLRRTRRVERSAVRELRVDIAASDTSMSRIDELAITGGSIAADTTSGELRFGLRLGEERAAQVVDEIERFWR